MQEPLVSVICLCYNHEAHVNQAINSVLQQSYGNIELIVVDDASTDQSRQLIRESSAIHGFQTILNDKNLGNCRAFNIGFRKSKGKYIIDLAADDMLLPDRIKIGVEQLEQKGKSYGVHFCDVNLTDFEGNNLGTHYKRDKNGKLLQSVPEGDIYAQLVEKYLICTPSMMMSRLALEDLNGYDESLTYEDFDFWVRSSRIYKYTFSDVVLVNRSILAKSLSKSQQQKKNIHTLSTAKVCEKILRMNRSEVENKALLKRANYELKWALITENWEASRILLRIKNKISGNTIRLSTEKLILRIKPPWHPFWQMFLKLIY